MINVSKNGRRGYAMVMNEPVNDVLGVVQCAIEGCQAYMPLMAGSDEESSTDQIEDFLTGHECLPNRYPPRRSRQYKQNKPTRK